jgi:hypothetical protein
MKKILFLFFTLLALSTMRASGQGVPAQDPTAHTSPARWSIGLDAGPAFPVGSFHRSGGADGAPLTAQTGGSAELSGSYRFWRSFGATLVVEGQENKGNNGIPYSFVPPGSTKAAGSMQGSDWKMARILTGVTYALPLTKKTGPELLFRVLGGIQRTASPDYKTDAVLYTEELYLTCNGCTGYAITSPGISFPWSFAYEADAGLQWRFHSRFSAIGYAGYEGSKPSKDLPNIGAYDPSTNTFITYPRKYTAATGTISLRAGVSYELSR